MGRPPIGERAMTPAEKQRRYRARKFGNKPPTPAVAAEAHIRELEEHIRKMTASFDAYSREMSARFSKLADETEQRALEDTARIRALEAQLVRERTRIKMLEGGLQAARRAERQRVESPKASKPPLPPDEARDRRIKALTTQNRNLRAELRHAKNYFDEEMAKKGGMNFKTLSAVARCLHPDTRDEVSDAELRAQPDARVDKKPGQQVATRPWR
jgi:hypothetical protein